MVNINFTPELIEVCSLVLEYIKKEKPEYSNVRLGIIAQMILESGWGRSGLSIHFNNYAGMKWREDIQLPPYIKRGIDILSVDYRDWLEKKEGAKEGKAGRDIRIIKLCHFPEVFFGFLARKQYRGIEDHLKDEKGYIAFLLSRDYCTSFPGARTVEEAKFKYTEAWDRVRHSANLQRLLDSLILPEWLEDERE